MDSILGSENLSDGIDFVEHDLSNDCSIEMK
jgi:hypothetical protein